MKLTIYTDDGVQHDIQSIGYSDVRHSGSISLGFEIKHAALLIWAYRFGFIIKGEDDKLYNIDCVRTTCKYHIQVYLYCTVGNMTNDRVISGGNRHVH